MEFKTCKLRDIATIVMGQSPKGTSYNNKCTGKEFLQGNRTFGRIYPKIDTWTTEPKKIAKEKSILMSVRAPVGELNIANREICIGRGLCAIEMKNKNNKYLFYLLKHSINKIKRKSSGTVFDSINKTELENIEIIDFDKETQDKITSILFSIDKKIELNNQINDNLYKFAINYLNNKKEETEVPIRNFAKIQGGYAFKSKDLIDNKTKNRIIKIKNLRSELNADVINSQFVEDKVIISLDSKFKLRTSDVTIAMTGAELGKTGFIYGFDNYYLNQRVGVIRGNNKEKELYLKILFLSDKFQSLLNSKGYGSAQPNISSSDIENILVNDITEVNLKDIYENLNSVYNRIISNCEENLNLERLQGSLLPKLMNGEINLDKIEI